MRHKSGEIGIELTCEDDDAEDCEDDDLIRTLCRGTMDSTDII